MSALISYLRASRDAIVLIRERRVLLMTCERGTNIDTTVDSMFFQKSLMSCSREMLKTIKSNVRTLLG